MKRYPFSLRALAEKYRSDRATIRRVTSGCKTKAEAVAVIKAWKAERKTSARGKPSEVDPDTGLTWHQAKLREDVLTARAERELERRLLGGDLVPVEIIERAAGIVASRFTQLVHEVYVFGGGWPNESTRLVATRLCEQAKEEFTLYIRQWLNREAEKIKNRKADAKALDDETDDTKADDDSKS